MRYAYCFGKKSYSPIIIIWTVRFLPRVLSQSIKYINLNSPTEVKLRELQAKKNGNALPLQDIAESARNTVVNIESTSSEIRFERGALGGEMDSLFGLCGGKCFAYSGVWGAIKFGFNII